MELQRSGGESPQGRQRRVPRRHLPLRQRAVLDTIIRYYRGTNEACPSTYVARQLSVHHSTIQDHLLALFRKGWLLTPNAPSVPTRW